MALRSDVRRLTEKTEENEESEEARFRQFLTVKGPPIFIVSIVLPLFMRTFALEPTARCALIMCGVLTLSLFELMPLFCVALCIPVLGSICAVFGEERTMLTTSRLLLGSFFNQTSFLVLGSLVINAVFEKCGTLELLTSALLRRWRLESKSFLLVIMLSTMASCAVLCNGSIIVLAALKPLLMTKGLGQLEVPVIKRLLLGVAFAANAGSTLLPISSTVNLITVSLLRDFDHKLSLWSWFFMAAPVAVPATMLCWWTLVHLYPAKHDEEEAVIKTVEEGLEEGPSQPALSRQASLSHPTELKMTESHWFMLGATCLTVMGTSIFAEALEPLLGHPAILALALVVVAFGSGFLSRDEFLMLEWDLLAIVGGTNVMALMVRETALAAHGSTMVLQSGLITSLSFWPFMVIVIVTLLVFGTICGHSLTGVIALPLLVALGVQLEAAQFFAMLCALVIPFGMGTQNASFDNSASLTLSRNLNRSSCHLLTSDYFWSGSAMAAYGAVLTLTVGFSVGCLQYGLPSSPSQTRAKHTPEELKPQVVKENRKLDLRQAPSILSSVERLHQFGQRRKRPIRRNSPQQSLTPELPVKTGTL